jgi:HAD superfamily hydrolase (TIGR01509 family)
MKGPGTEARKRAAIFDLDGTLVDSMPLVVAMFTHAVEPFRARPAPSEVLTQLGGPPEVCIRRLLGPAAAASYAEANTRMLEYESEHFQEVRPFDGSRELLSSLLAGGVRLAIWTGRDRQSTVSILNGIGLARFFDALVCGDDLDSHKPDPAGLLLSIELLGVTTKEAIFVGDNDTDVEGGHAAGIHTILIHNGRADSSNIFSRAAEVYADTGNAFAAVARHFRQPG